MNKTLYKKLFFITAFLIISQQVFCWGFFAHHTINKYAVFLLPPQMLGFYKQHIDFIEEHAVDPDKRRYAVQEEGPRHYLDIDQYGAYPYTQLPRQWDSAIAKFGKDSLLKYGIVPWWIEIMQARLTRAFKEKNAAAILKLSAEIGHYIADAHVPLHACSNHNGQFTNQRGIHAFWESRVPELFAEKQWDFFIGHANYIEKPSAFIWQRLLESAAEADSVLTIEKQLSATFINTKYAFEERNGVIIRQYSSDFSNRYNQLLKGMVERRMQQSMYAVASFWYTAWVNAGQPDLNTFQNPNFSQTEINEYNKMDSLWRHGKMIGREE